MYKGSMSSLAARWIDLHGMFGHTGLYLSRYHFCALCTKVTARRFLISTSLVTQGLLTGENEPVNSCTFRCRQRQTDVTLLLGILHDNCCKLNENNYVSR